MKKIFLTLILVLPLMFFSFAQIEKHSTNDSATIILNSNYSKASTLQSIMDRYSKDGLPGVSLAVYSESEGWWEGSAGYARIESKTPMKPTHLQFLQSVSKTYMAVVILKLHEEKKIQLDELITRYLPAKYSRHIKNADKITVRMLLNHRSGVPEYSDNPAYISYLLLHPGLVFAIEDALKFISNEDLQFAPGSRYKYTNTNYLLLAMIADAITGDHAAYMNKMIFRKLSLKNTFYRSSPGYLKYPNLVNSYWDILHTKNPADISSIQNANVATMKGDDGIVCTPEDAVKFLKGLMEGKLLKDSSLALMQKWVNNDEGKPTYGMGLFRFAEGDIVGYGHGGGGIGAGCLLIYIPVKKVYIFMATNIGVLFDDSPAIKAGEMRNEILATILS
ncbi:MAG TPA: serine hydrolase domain-containing protein [Puia sp.]|nr:serine hydrolase domain-containing protein [Puia sp.]